MKERRKAPSRGSLALLLSLTLVVGATLPSTSGCAKRSDELRNCDIPALFESSCDGSVCHGGATPRANLDLISPGVDQRLFHVPATDDCDERPLVFPGNPEESVLYLKVSNKDPFCGRRMPINRELSGSELACLRQYIEQAGTDTEGQDCETCGTIQCIDFDSDNRHCGGCDKPCEEGTVCGEGMCANPCLAGETRCDGACVVLSENDAHCGVCGHRCGQGSSCEAGVCTCDPLDGTSGGAGASSLPAEVPSFQEDLLPIIENTCTGAKCHDEGSEESELWLLPDGARTALVGIDSGGCGAKKFVVPSNPDQSYLIEKIVGGRICEGGRMPFEGDPLPDAVVEKFVRWVCAGAPDN